MNLAESYEHGGGGAGLLRRAVNRELAESYQHGREAGLSGRAASRVSRITRVDMIYSPQLGSLMLFSFLSLTPESPLHHPAVCRTSGRWHRSISQGRCQQRGALASRLASLSGDGRDGREGGAWRVQEWDNRIRVDIRYDGERFAGFQTGSADAPRTVHYLVRAACRNAFSAPDLELVTIPPPIPWRCSQFLF